MENSGTRLWIQISGLFEMQFESVPTKIFYHCFVKWYMLIQRVGHGKFCSNGSLEVEVWQFFLFLVPDYQWSATTSSSASRDHYIIGIFLASIPAHFLGKHFMFSKKYSMFSTGDFPFKFEAGGGLPYCVLTENWILLHGFFPVVFQRHLLTLPFLILATPLHNWHYCWQFRLHLRFSHYERLLGIWIVS